jgi:hypothetical protein
MKFLTRKAVEATGGGFWVYSLLTYRYRYSELIIKLSYKQKQWRPPSRYP